MMNKLFVYSVAISVFLFGVRVSYADPTITSISGKLSHKGSIAISGSNFGIKSPAPPKIWDPCDESSTSDLNTFYPGDRYPKPCPGTPGETPYLMDYRTSFHGFSTMPNNHITKFISGAATTCNGSWDSDRADNVITTGSWESPKLFLMYYYRMANTWELETDPTIGDNLKEVAANGCDGGLCGTYLNGLDNYIDWCNAQTPMISKPSNAFMRGGPTSGSGCASGEYVSTSNPMQKWIHAEVFWDTVGWQWNWSDNSSAGKSAGTLLQDIRHAGGTGILPKTISIGGFTRWPRVNATGNYRYWAGIYADDTYARVMVGNNEKWDNCSIREPQIPTAWSDTSISVTVNLGGLPSSGTVYLFVFDANNNHNALGYPVSIGRVPVPPALNP